MCGLGFEAEDTFVFANAGRTDGQLNQSLAHDDGGFGFDKSVLPIDPYAGLEGFALGLEEGLSVEGRRT